MRRESLRHPPVVLTVGEAARAGVRHPPVPRPRPLPGILECGDGVGISAVLRMAWLQPAMLPEVRAADRMDVGLARRSVHVDAIRASVSRCHAPAPHCRRRSDCGPGTGTRRCSTQPAVPIIVPRETTATPHLRLPFPAGGGAAASGSLMLSTFQGVPLQLLFFHFWGTSEQQERSYAGALAPILKRGRIHGRAAEDT